MENCLFCKIINKEIPAEIVRESSLIIVFKDINPKARIHYLIVPKEHSESISSENSEEVAKTLVKEAKTIAQEQKIIGYKLLFNVNKEGGQEVNHLHLHFLAN